MIFIIKITTTFSFYFFLLKIFIFMLNNLFFDKNKIFFFKTGLLIDFFIKQLIKYIYQNIFIWSFNFFFEKYLIEFFFKNLLISFFTKTKYNLVLNYKFLFYHLNFTITILSIFYYLM